MMMNNSVFIEGRSLSSYCSCYTALADIQCVIHIQYMKQHKAFDNSVESPLNADALPLYLQKDTFAILLCDVTCVFYSLYTLHCS